MYIFVYSLFVCLPIIYFSFLVSDRLKLLSAFIENNLYLYLYYYASSFSSIFRESPQGASPS